MRLFISLKRPLAVALLAWSCWAPAVAVAQEQHTALPALGEAGDLSLSDERRLGARIVRDLYASGDVATDAVLAQYVDNMWRSLYAAARQRGDVSPEMAQQLAWQVLLINDSAVNAFALPGGYLGVNLGLIAMADDAHALASVLAHELSHVTQRHIARIMNVRQQQSPWLMAATILAVIAAGQNTDVGNAALLGGHAAVAQQSLNFSRDMEREADRQGLQVQHLAGFDSAGFARMFAQLQNVNRLNDDGAFPYLRSHPLTSQRVSDMQLRLAGLPPPPQGVLRADWLDPAVQALMRARATVLASTRQDMWQAWVNVAASKPVLAKQADTPTWVLWYRGAVAATQLQQGDQAWRWFEMLDASVRSTQPNNADLQRLVVASALHAWQAMADKPAAFNGVPIDQLVRESLSAAAAVPALSRHAYRSTLIEAASVAASAPLGTVSRATQTMAEQALRAWLVDYAQDAQAWQVAAGLAQALAQPVRALRAQAESQAYTGQLDAAKDRLMAAQALVNQRAILANGDEQEASIVAVRLQQVSDALRAQQEDDKR
jgi:beta-barrel assembly-enhancing protease